MDVYIFQSRLVILPIVTKGSVFKRSTIIRYLLIEVILFYVLKCYLNILITFFLSHLTLVYFRVSWS